MPSRVHKEEYIDRMREKFGSQLELLYFDTMKEPVIVKCVCGSTFRIRATLLFNSKNPCFVCRDPSRVRLNFISFEYYIKHFGWYVVSDWQDGFHQCRIACSRCDNPKTYWYKPSLVISKTNKCLPKCPNCDEYK